MSDFGYRIFQVGGAAAYAWGWPHRPVGAPYVSSTLSKACRLSEGYAVDKHEVKCIKNTLYYAKKNFQACHFFVHIVLFIAIKRHNIENEIVFVALPADFYFSFHPSFPAMKFLFALSAFALAAFSHAYCQVSPPKDTPVRIRNIAWTGNKVFDAKALATAMQWAADGSYKKDGIQLRILEGDLNGSKADGKSTQGITSLYRNRGYWFFSYQIIEKTVDATQVDLQVVVSEGPQMRVGRIIVEGRAGMTPDDIRRLTGIVGGEIFDESKIIASFGALQKTGRIKGNTQVTPRLNPDTQAIDIAYVFSED